MKKIIIVICVLLVVLLATAVALPFFIDLNRFKGPIVDQIEGALHREVSLGDIRLTILSGLGAEIDGLTVSESQAFARDKFVELSSLKVRLSLMPLLSRKIEVKRIELERPRIHVGRSEDGAWSFSDIVGSSEPEKSAEAEEPSEAGGPGVLAGLLITKLSIRDGSVTLDDRTAGSGKGATLTVERIDLDVSGLALDSPVQIDLAARLPGGDGQNIEIRGTVGPVPESLDPAKVGMDLRLRLSPLDPSALTSALALAPSLSLEGLEVGADLHLKGELGSLVKVDGSLGLGPLDVDVSGTVKDPMESPVLDARVSAPKAPLGDLASLPLLREKLPEPLSLGGEGSLELRASGSLQALRFEGGVNLAGANLGWADSFMKGEGVPMEVRLKGSKGEDEVEIEGLTFRLADLNLSASGSVKNLAEPVVRIKASSTEAKLAPLASLVPALEDLGLSGVFSLKAKVSGKLDALAADLSLSAPEIAFVRPPSGESGEKGSAGRLRALQLDASASIGGEEIRAKGTLEADRAELEGLTIEEIASSFRAEGSDYFLDRLSLRLCSGTMKGSARIAMPDGGTPTWTLEAKTDGIDVNQLLSAVSELKDTIHGSFRSDLEVSGQGTGGDEILRTVKGSGDARISGVKIANFNLGDAVMSEVAGIPAVSKLAAAGGEKAASHQETSFDSLDASFTLGDEKITLDHLAMNNMGTSKATGADAVFSGVIGLDTSLDLKGQLILSQKHSVEMVRKFKEAKALANSEGRIVFPMIITGEVSSPRPKVDVQYISKAMLRYGGKKLLEDALDVEIPEGEGEQKPLEGLLKGLIEKEKAKRKKKREKKKK